MVVTLLNVMEHIKVNINNYVIVTGFSFYMILRYIHNLTSVESTMNFHV